MFDLSRLDTYTLSNSGVSLPLTFNGKIVYTDEGHTININVIGQDGDHFKSVKYGAMRNARDLQKSKKLQDEPTFEELEEEAKKRCADFICGWSDNLMLDGEQFKYSRENAVKLMLDVRFTAIYLFVNNEVMNRENFLPQPLNSF